MPIDPVTIGAVTGAAKLLEKPLANLYSSATGPFKKLAANWVVAGKRDSIVQLIEEVELVRTISGADRVPLSSFYYPCRILDSPTSKAPKAVNSVVDISPDKNIIIQGTVGQGKSILMRYLCVQELRRGTHIPIFIELRTIESNSSLKSVVLSTLESVGFGTLSEDDLQFLLKNGSLIFFLDGFDEIKRELAIPIQTELNAIMRFAPTTRWVVSTRPGSLAGHISGLPRLRMVRLAQLTNEDFDPFLEALKVPAETRVKLIAAITSSPTEIRGVLRTPLMLTLLNMTFGTSTHVPGTLHEFYESMFLFLVYRHDETKPGFVRQKATRLSNSELQDAFEHFAFLSKEYGVSLSDDEFANCARNAAKLCDSEFTPEGFRTDLTETVCLMLRDGLKTAYIHRSIQEFFSAFFVKHLGAEDQVRKIYERINSTTYMNWQQELRFLEQIDKYRYIEYFRLPVIRSFLVGCGYKRDAAVCLTKADFLRFLSTQPIYYVPREAEAKPTTHWIVGVTVTKDFNAATFEVSKLFDCDGYTNDLSALFGLTRVASSKITRLDKRYRSPSPETNAALAKFRDFAKKMDKEQQKMERILSDRKTHFRDLLLPT